MSNVCSIPQVRAAPYKKTKKEYEKHLKLYSQKKLNISTNTSEEEKKKTRQTYLKS